MLDFNKIHSFGLDISDKALRWLELKKGGQQIKGADEIKLPPDIIEEGEIQDEKAFLSYLKKLFTKKRPSTQRVVASLPERKSFFKLVNIPLMSEKEIGEAVKWELTQKLPLTLEEIYFDWQTLPHSNQSDYLEILVGGSFKSIVDQYLNILLKANLFPIALEIESQAILRALKKNAFLSDLSPSLIIDWGQSLISFIIASSQKIFFTSATSQGAGDILTKLLQKKLNLSLEKAEKLKILSGLDAKRNKGRVKKILEPELIKVIRKIKEISEYCQSLPQFTSISQVILLGGGSQLKKLDIFLKQQLDLKVEKVNPFIKIKNTSLIKGRTLSFITALGLALRNI